MRRPQFVRFTELDGAHVNRDFQIHTRLTDGEATIDDIVSHAEQLGLQEIAFTEHVRRESTHFAEFATAVRQARQRTSLQVYLGVEAKALDDQGSLDAPPTALGEVDLVLGSVHRFPVGSGEFMSAEAFEYAEAARRERTLALALIRHAPITVLAHPGGMCQRAFGTFPVDYLEELMQAALERGVAIEINTAYTRDLDGLLAVCRKMNPLVSIGSDVHRLGELGTCRDALRARGIGCR